MTPQQIAPPSQQRPERNPLSLNPRAAIRAMAPPVIVLALLWLITDVVPWGGLLVPPLENRFQATELGDPQTIAGLVVLIGNDQRLREAGRLARAYPHLHIFVSGVSATTPLAVTKLLGGGIAPERVTLETVSSNTYTNAQQTAAFLKNQPPKRWLLVTSAHHMPRAMGVFRNLGITLEPWPVYDLAHVVPRPDFVARHEWYGLIGYWLTGKTATLFPSP